MIEAEIGIIGGGGWLGSAVARSLLAAGAIEPARLTLSGRSERPASCPEGVRWTHDNAELVERSEIVVLSVRPAQFPDLRIDARGRLVVSVMAGVSARTIAERTGTNRIVRSMPNAAAAIRRSFTPWHAGEAVSAGDRATVQAMFDACGEGAEVPDEAHVDYCAGLTGSGAAFPALLAEALAADAVRRGLSPAFARRAAKSVVAGASRLFADGDADTAAVVREMIEYRGTTAAALQAMLAAGFNEAVAAGLDAASAKGRALSGAGPEQG